jgi:elongator complex protein 2
MNKQVKVETSEGGEDEETFDFSNFDPDVLTNKKAMLSNVKNDFGIPPDEDYLTNNTLWPESCKLYGHGYEIIAVTTSHKGDLIASSGKAQSKTNSKLFIWDAIKNQLISKLDGHSLTIVQIEFSPDDNLILSVSRDRTWCLFKRGDPSTLKYELFQTCNENTFARIIWGCSWSYDSKIFAAGSRDCNLKIFKNETESSHTNFKEVICSEFKIAITSVNILPDLQIKSNYIAFVGFESGDIKILAVDTEKNFVCKVIYDFPTFLSHGLTVKRIRSFIIQNTNHIRIASCSDDFSTRIYEISSEFLENKL